MKINVSLFQRFGRGALRAILAGAFAGALMQNASAALTHRYSFTSDASDSIAGAHGTLVGSVTISNNAAVFPNAAGSYVELPPGLISNYTSVTFEMWVNVGVNGTWEELYAFGDQVSNAGVNTLMFTPHSGGGDFRMSYKAAAEYVVTGPGVLDSRGPVCVTCVYDIPNTLMSLYTNGVLVSTTPYLNTAVGTPVALPATFSLANIYNTYSWLGRSLYTADSPYNGTMDEFRIYDTPLTALQVAVNNAAGPNNVVTNPGALLSLQMAATNMIAGISQPAKLVANFASITNVPVTGLASNWLSSNPGAITVSTQGVLTSIDLGTATITAMYGGLTATSTVSVLAVVTNIVLSAPTSVIVGSARQMQLTAKYSDGSLLDVTSSATYTSSAPSVVTIPSAGRLAAWTNGTATVTAIFKGFLSSKTVTVAGMSMTHRWSFNDDLASTNAVDSVGGSTGTLNNGSFFIGDGTVLFGGGGQSTGGFVAFPPNLFTNYGAVTFEAWVTDSGSPNWGRIYDFGNGSETAPGTNVGTRYMFLALPSSALNLRGAYTITGGGAGEQVVQWANGGRPPVGVKSHVVWTSEGASKIGRLYVDGLLVASNANVTLTPEDIGSTTNNWLGRSQFTVDPSFIGAMDEFRTYNGALDPLSIAIDTAAGPDVLTNTPGALQSLQLTLSSPMNDGDRQQGTLVGTFANVANPVPMTTLPQVQYSSSNPNVASVDALGNVTANSGGTVTITATALGKTAGAPVTVIAVPLTLTHRYSFTADYSDSIGGADGAPQGNVQIANGQAVFDTNSVSYVLLPPNLFIDYNSITLEAWYTDNGSGTWGRIADIGRDTGHYMFFSANPLRGAYNAGSGEGVNVVSVNRPAISTQHHVVFTQDAITRTAKLYIDGNLALQNVIFALRPRDVGATTLSYLGKSQFNDPYFNGTINEFRTWQGAINPLQVAVDYAAGPDRVVANAGTLLSIQIVLTNTVAGWVQPATVLANFASLSGVPVTGLASNWVTSDPSVLKVSSQGVVTAVGAGTATIGANFGGLSASTAVNVSAAPTPVLTHRYSFTNDATDSIGGANGTLNGGAVISGGKVVLYGTNSSYVILPGHLFDGFTEVTFETWATFDANTTSSSRLWDFGDTNRNSYISFTPRSGGPNTVLLYNFGSGQTTFTMTGTAASYNTNKVHFAWVVSPVLGSVKLYINGLWKETFAYTAALSNIVNSVGYLGHTVTLSSPPGDLNGSIDEFRIWNGALNLQQIQSSYAAGPDTVLANPDAPQSLTLWLNDSTNVVGTIQRPKALGNFASVVNIDLTGSPVVISSSNPNVVKVLGDDRLQAVGVGTATITASYGGKTATNSVTVVPKALTLTHKYTFASDASDSVGKAHGMLYGQAGISNGAVVLNGNRNPQTFVDLPSDLISGYDALTVEAWATIGVPGVWANLFAFGNHVNATGLDNIYYVPRSGAADVARLGLTAAAVAEVDADSGTVTNRAVHIVCVVDSVAGTMTVYTNGVLAGSITTALPLPLTSVNNVYSFLGRSQYNDNWLIGSIDEFRVYYGAMTASQVAASFAAGPTPTPTQPKLTITRSGNSVIVSWPATADTAAYTLQFSTVLGTGAVWTPISTPAPSGGFYQVTIPISSNQKAFYRLIK